MKDVPKVTGGNLQTKKSDFEKEKPRKDLVRTIEAFFVRNRRRFAYLHIGMFITLALLLIVPALLPVPAEDATVLNNFTRFAGFLIWGLWFPLVLLSVVFFGRLWCGLLCPHGALSEYASKKGLSSPVPKWLRWGGVPIASFVLITTFGQIVGIREYPMAALEVLGGTLIIAVLVGFVYANGKRTFCRSLCPLGPLLGILSRLGAVSFERVGRESKGYPCPTFINTAKKVASSNCIECFKCVNPGVPGSLYLQIRRPGKEIEEIEKRKPDPWEVIYLFSATGLALGAFYWLVNPFYVQYKQALGGILLGAGLGDWIGWSGPWWLMVNYPAAGDVFMLIDLISVTSFMFLCMTGVAAVLFFLTALSALLVRSHAPLMTTITKLGYLYAPVVLVSLVIGLGLILFQSLGAFGLSRETIRMIQGGLFASGGIWSTYLAVRLQGGLNRAIVPSIIGIGFLGFAWYQALF